MKKIIPLIFWILISLWGVWIIFINNPHYVSLAEIQCKNQWREWEKEKKNCSTKIFIDKIEKKEKKHIKEIWENFDIQISYPQYGIKKLDNLLSNDVLEISKKFKKNLDNIKKRQLLLIEFKEYETKEKNIISIAYDIYDTTLKREIKKYYKTFVYDINKWNIIKIEDLFKEKEEAIKKINFLVKEKLKNKIDQEYINSIETWKNSEDLKKFCFEKDMLIIFYPIYKYDTYKYHYKEIKIPLINLKYYFN